MPPAIHVDQLLTNMSIGYMNEPDVYISDMLAPMVPVMRRSNIVPKYVQSHWFRNLADERAPGTKSQGGGFTADVTDTYYCRRYSFRGEIYDEDRDNTDQPFDQDRDTTMFVTDKIRMKREINFATNFFTTTVWGTDKTGAVDFTQWSNYATSVPLVDITAYRSLVSGKIGRKPNKFAMGQEVWDQLKWHPDLIDTIKHTQRAMMTLDILAALLEFEQMLVGEGIYTTSPEGTAEASVTYQRIWGKHALMLYCTPSASLMRPTAIYTFVWTRVANALQYILRHRDDEREADIIEANSYFDQKVTSANAGLFMASAVA